MSRAGQAISAEAVSEAVMELTEALKYVDDIRSANFIDVSYETMQRSGFKRESWKRKYTLADAKRDAEAAAMRLRNAWELLDPRS